MQLSTCFCHFCPCNTCKLLEALGAIELKENTTVLLFSSIAPCHRIDNLMAIGASNMFVVVNTAKGIKMNDSIDSRMFVT